MRFGPIAAALSLCLAATASIGQAETVKPNSRAAMLIAQGRAALEAGNAQAAIDSFEAALTIDPAYTPLFLDLANAARKEGLQGKAIHYYREALQRDPGNLLAIAGEGAALVEKGAVEKARRNLARLKTLCGNRCEYTVTLARVIDRGPQPHVLRAEAVLPDAEVTQN